MIRPASLSALVFLATGVLTTAIHAADLEIREVPYQQEQTSLMGYLAKPATATADQMRPGILVVHQWMGLGDYEQSRCRQLASLGYVAFALDIYGDGVRPANPGEASKTAEIYKNDRELYRQRLNAGLAELRSIPGVDPNRIAAIGYCFGGTGVIELARSGATIDGIVSFHGLLDSPNPEDGKNITAKVLVCHGEDDPFVPADGVEAFQSELNDAGVDWQMVTYSDTVHGFTQPMAGSDPSQGAAYNALSDERSWTAMKSFFSELFPTLETPKMPLDRIDNTPNQPRLPIR